MKRPSIYSDNYGKDLKKKNFIRSIMIFLLIVFTLTLLLYPYIKGKIDEYKNKTKESVTHKVENRISPEKEKTSIFSERNKDIEESSKDYIINYKISTGEEIKIYYVIDEGRIMYKGIDSNYNRFTYDISPDKSKLLINEIEAQTIVVFDREKTPKDFTMETFDYAGNGKMSRAYYSKKENFIWSKDATFLNEHIIVFRSNVSLALSLEYIWSVDTETGNFKMLDKTRGSQIKVLNNTRDGIGIQVDGKILIIDGNLDVKEN